MNPLAKKKAMQMSQGIGSPKPENAAAKGRVLVRTETPRPNSATAPSGNGCAMIPTIVAKKIASSCHAFLETPAGTGENQRITPVAMEARRGFMAAPCHAGAGAGFIEAPAAEALIVLLILERFFQLRLGLVLMLKGRLESARGGVKRWRFGE